VFTKCSGADPRYAVELWHRRALTGWTASGLHALADAHLAGADRYGLHDLLRAYATSLFATEQALAERDEVLGALFE
jgi:hypothetical protein